VTVPEGLTGEAITAFEEEIAARKPVKRSHSVNRHTGGVMAMMPAVMHFLKWLYWHGVRAEPTIEAAYYNRRREPHPQLRARQGSSRAVKDIAAHESPTSPPAFQVVENEMHEYLLKVRGVAARTSYQWLPTIRSFLQFLHESGATSISQIRADHIRDFVESFGNGRPRGNALRGEALRMFLRFAKMKGYVSADMGELVPKQIRRRLAHLPEFLTDAEVERALAVPDRRTVGGVRNHAMLAMLATYGIRTGELAGLTLDDIDWEHDIVRIRQGKVGRTHSLPLLPGVGNALLAYIRDVRPTVPFREVFLTIYSPPVPITPSTVYGVVRRILEGAGIRKHPMGGHLFRHTAATRLVAGMQPMKTVGDILGHSCLGATAIYTKVAIEQLRAAALSWGEVTP
jgi:site-specific recombinase XerD